MKLLYASENVGIIEESEPQNTISRDFRELVSKALSVKKARDFIDFMLLCPASMFEQSIENLGPDWAPVENLLGDEGGKPYKGSVIDAIDRYFPDIEPLDMVAIKSGAIGTYQEYYDPFVTLPTKRDKGFSVKAIAPTKRGLNAVCFDSVEALCVNTKLLGTYAAIACGEHAEEAIKRIDLGLPESVQAIDTRFWPENYDDMDLSYNQYNYLDSLDRDDLEAVRSALRARGFSVALSQTADTLNLTEHTGSPIRFCPSTWSDAEVAADLFVSFIAMVLNSYNTDSVNPPFKVVHDDDGFHIVESINPVHEFYRVIARLAELGSFRLCANCGSPFLVDLSRGNEGMYCSASCNTIASAARRELAKALAASGVPVEDAIGRIGKDYESSIRRWYADTKALLG